MESVHDVHSLLIERVNHREHESFAPLRCADNNNRVGVIGFDKRQNFRGISLGLRPNGLTKFVDCSFGVLIRFVTNLIEHVVVVLRFDIVRNRAEECLCLIEVSKRIAQ